MNKKDRRKLFLGIVILGLLLSISYIYPSHALKSENKSYSVAVADNVTNNFVYLSDMNYITENNWSFNGWTGHDIQIDKNQDGKTIELYVDGENRTFTKGIGIHAKGQVVYDISEYSTQYPRFIAYLGLDSSKSGSIWFKIDVSNDGTAWETVVPKTINLTTKTDAVKVDVNVAGYKYLKIYVDPNGSNASDHGNIADAKFVTEDYVDLGYPYTKIHKLDYYDEIISAHDVDYNLNNNYHLVLEREVINKLGFWNLQYAYETMDNFDEIMSWILSSDRILENVIEVGNISDTTKFLIVLNDLYVKYKECLTEEDGYVYEKMMIALATAYSTDYIHNPHNYGFHAADYDYIERFRLVKKMYDEDLIPNTVARPYKTWFKNYQMELMRMVMQDFVRSDETLWLNYYIKNYRNYNINSTTLVPYGKFNTPFSTYNDEANYATFDSKYHFSEYNELFPDEQIPYGDNPSPLRYWMYFSGRGICWRISRIGQSLTRSLGLPATGTYQPQHESYLAYSQDASGNGIWTIWNNIGGWGRASTSWGGSKRYRGLFDWGNKSYAWSTTGGNSTAYILLGQANINNYEAYKKSLYINLVANSYNDVGIKAEAYKKALGINNLNLDSYEYLINTYKNMDGITDDDWMELVDDIIDAYTYYPNAMYDLITKLILPQIQDGAKKADINIKVKEALNKAYVATSNEILQPIQTQQVAASLLGSVNEQIASFSFDGEKANEIVLLSPYDTYNFSWSYSLDGGNTWSLSVGDTTSIRIPDDKIKDINAENDIKIHIDGLDGVAYTIDITEGTISDKLYANDLENRVVGVDLTYEWRNNESDPWTSYKVTSPNNTGNKILEVRNGATGTSLPSESQTFTFTEDNQPNTRKYVPVSHLSIEAFSDQNTNYHAEAVNTIDGNYNTFWYNNVSNRDTNPSITIKLDKTRFVSAVEIVPQTLNNYGRLKAGVLMGKTKDGEWFELKRFSNLSSDYDILNIEIDNPVEVDYLRIDADTTNFNNYFFVKMINVFQDMTKNPRPTAGIAYSTTEPTTENVIARLVNVSVQNYEITSEGGDTHVFTEEGDHSFTFTFIDKDTGVEGSALAKVDWIDRVAPTATIEYSTSSPVNSSVVATLKPSEDIKVTNNGYYSYNEETGEVFDKDGNVLTEYIVDEDGVVKDTLGNVVNPFTYEFFDNGEFTFEFVDKAGNVGRATARVNLLDFDKPEATLSYDTTSLTNKNVTVTIDFDEEAVVTNNNNSRKYTFNKNGEFTFEFRDIAGNASQITAKVDWIDKIVPIAGLKYDRTSNTKGIVTIINPSEEIVMESGNGTYEFTKNGSYDIYFTDKAGNRGKVIAVIDWLVENNNPTISDPIPDNPSNPNNGNNEPSNPIDSGSNNSNNGNNSVKPNDDKINYKQYLAGNVIVEMADSDVIEGLSLTKNILELNNTLKQDFSSNSSYFEVYFSNAQKEQELIRTNNYMNLRIILNPQEEFMGIYQVNDDDSYETLTYEFGSSTNEIIVKTKFLGKYIVAYKAKTVENTLPVGEKDSPVINEDNLSNTNYLWMAGSLVVLAIGGTIYALKRKNS